MSQESIIRDIYTSDVILMDKETEMLHSVDESFFDCMENFYRRIKDQQLIMTEEEFQDLEKKFNEFYFEYGYVQFKRGLEIGLALHHIH